MTYTKIVDYAAKDLLLHGDPAKAVKGTEIGAEFDAIAAADALNLKASTIHASTNKGTPIDADEICALDSTTSFSLIRITWANLKTTLGGIFASIAGSASQVFNVSSATASTHAPRASQTQHQKVLPVNGCCMVDQVNSGALITPLTNTYPIDNYIISLSQASKLQTQQVTTTLLTLNVSHALRHSVLAQYAAGAAEQFAGNFPIEGIDIANWQWGTANAAAVSLQFKARASVAGTYSGSIRNAAVNRSYPFSFTLAANTDTLVKIENIAGDTSGTWLATEVTGAFITFNLGSGANLLGTAGAWAAANYVGVTGSTAFVNQVNGSTLDISEVLINEGSFCREFPRQKKREALFDAQYYFARISGIPGASAYPSLGNGVVTAATIAGSVGIKFPRRMRTAPTVSYGGTITLADGTTAATLTSITNAYTGYEVGLFNLTASGGGLAVNRPACIYLQNGSANYMDFDARI